MFISLEEDPNTPLVLSGNSMLTEKVVDESNEPPTAEAKIKALERQLAEAKAQVQQQQQLERQKRLAEVERAAAAKNIPELTKIIIEDEPKPKQEIKTDNNGVDSNSNLRPHLLVKPCQAGKTGEALTNWVIEQSQTETASSTEVRKIAFFVCDNSLLLTKQTEIRAKNKDTIDIQGDIIIISCKEKIRCIDKLFGAINKNSNISTILCCGNAIRLQDISELSELLSHMAKKFEISIYVDEADKILNSLSAKNQVHKWRQPGSLIKQLLLITATPFESTSNNLVEDYGEIELLPVEIVTRDNYHRFSNSHHIDTSSIKSSANVDYTAEVFANFIPEGPALGEIYFIPAEHKKDTHDDMQELLLNLGFNCVIKINGTRKEITILNDSTEDPLIITFSDIAKELKGTPNEEFSPSNNEISRWLGNYYSRNNGKDKWIMAITGNMCISRGISIQSPECFITHAIYGPNCAGSKTNLYQMYARICGNICTFPKYIETGGPTVYCSKKDFDECCRMEQLAINLATYSQSNGDEGGVIVDKDKLSNMWDETKKYPIIFCDTDLRKNYDYDTLAPFNTKEEAIASIREYFPNWKPNTKFEEENGFLKGYIRKPRILSWEDVKKERQWGVGVSVPQRLQPCYLDITDPTTLKWATWIYIR